ncbi:MAG TPA: WYL domain-containing protein [Chloroflexota bacterium]|nr:WYL domain-containing protein [Chloroflexota bacterium]
MIEPSYPTTRVLAMLELLQTYGRMSGPQLSQRLGIGERTVRRYVTLLADLGIYVEAARGRDGGYRLRPGFKLPPLMFSEEETLAVVLGLLVVRGSRLAGAPADVEGALHKLERVAPAVLRDRVRALQATVLRTGLAVDTPPAGAILGALSEGAYRRRRVGLRYRSRHGEETARMVDLYGVVCLDGAWYAVGYDHLRSDLRTFRVDRVLGARMGEETFIPPTDFDVVAYLEHALATAPGALAIEVLLETTVEEARRLIPARSATLEETPRGVLARGQAQDAEELGVLAHILAGLGCPLIVYQPRELRDKLRALARHTAGIADRT